MKSLLRWRFAVAAAVVAGGTLALAAITACGGDDGPITIELVDFSMLPSVVKLEKGQQVQIKVVNKGLTSHDLKLQGKSGSQVLPPGYSEVITIGPFDSSLQAWCTIEGHRALGMEMTFEVVEPR